MRILWKTIAGLAAALALTAAVSACSSARSDKAGGSHPTKPLLLTMANGNTLPGELQSFVDEVDNVSHGTIRIEFKNRWRAGEVNYETGVIRDVAAGKADVGWVGSRAWDFVGITGFDALHAPFLIDSYALEERVLESSILDGPLKKLSQLGLVGLGILPGPMRKPLGVDRSLLRPAAFHGLRIGIQASPVASETLQALGATAVPLIPGGQIKGLNGIEQQLSSIYQSTYDAYAKYLVANVDLWPRPIVLFIGRRAFDRLRPSQRALLITAAKDAVPTTLAAVRAEDQQAAAGLCRRGLNLAFASANDLARLRDAVAPVYATLERDAITRRIIREIQGMRAGLRAEPETLPTCQRQARHGSATLPDGTYESTMTSAVVRRAQVPANDPLYRVLPIRHTLVLRSGNFVLYDADNNGHREVGISGTYSIYRDRIIFVSSSGEDKLHFAWSFNGTTLRFLDLPYHGAGYYGATFTPAWTRIR